MATASMPLSTEGLNATTVFSMTMGVNAVLYYGPTIFEQSGLSGGDSLFYQVLVGVTNMLTTVIALLIIDKVGRKKLVYYGVSGMFPLPFFFSNHSRGP